MMENENRYRRQISFGAIGKSGQEKIGASRVLICGCGALGSMIATILARAGVGTLRLLDFDRVEFGNLHRQFLFDEKDAIEKRYKVETAAEKLAAANSSVRIEPFVDRFTRENADFFLDEIDLILDGTDNFPTRFLLNKKAVRRKIPWITAGVLGASGQVLSIVPGKTPCLSCLFPDENPSVPGNESPEQEEYAILGPTVAFAASFQTLEALKILSGNTESLNGTLFAFDLWENRFPRLNIATQNSTNPCSLCGYVFG